MHAYNRDDWTLGLFFALSVLNSSIAQELASIEHSKAVNSIAVSPCGNVIASASSDHTVHFWDLHTRKETAPVLKFASGFTNLMFSPDGKKLAIGSEVNQANQAIGLISVLEVSSQRPICSIPISGGGTRLTFSPDGKCLATGSGYRECQVKLWDPTTGREIATLEGSKSHITALVFSPNGKMLASGSEDGSIRLWDPVARKENAVIPAHPKAIRSLCFMPDGKTLISSSDLLPVKWWDVASGKQRGQVFTWGTRIEYWTPGTKEMPGDSDVGPGSVFPLALSPDGKRLALQGEKYEIVVFDLVSGQRLAQLEGHRHSIQSIAFTLDGKHLVTGGRDRAVKIWEVPGPD